MKVVVNIYFYFIFLLFLHLHYFKIIYTQKVQLINIFIQHKTLIKIFIL